MNYQIAVDSSANLKSDTGIAVVPLKIVTDQREFVDDAGLDLPEMLTYLEGFKGRSGTSCPNIGDWLESFGDAERIFVITITSGLSGCYNAAVQAKEEYEAANPGRKVCTLDSLSAGPELALIAEKLRELDAAGHGFEEIETAVRQYMTHTHLVFCLSSLTNLARNGRVSPLVAKAAGLLGIRIVGRASDEGTLQPLHKCRGEQKTLSTMVKEMTERGFRGGKVRIAHCCNPDGAQALSSLLKADFPNSDVQISECAGLCSFYAEKGGMLVGYEDSL